MTATDLRDIAALTDTARGTGTRPGAASFWPQPYSQLRRLQEGRRPTAHGCERTDEMRRALIGLAVTAFTVLAFAGPASAAPGQVTRFSFHGIVADAFWSTSSATSFTDTTLSVSQSMQGSELFVDQFTGNTDANGNFTG